MRLALATAFALAAVLLAGAWFTVSWLLGSPPTGPAEPLSEAGQLARLALVFAAVAGTGALFALVTAYRRQRVGEAAGERAERVHAVTEHDITERRATDLYGQAIGHLGHDRPAVRLGGLYSLERLAQVHPQYRQTVVDIYCAYLRMPFQSPADEPRPADDDARQEFQVRQTAQRLLARHLVLPTVQDAADQSAPQLEAHWEGMRIDLTGAYLVNFDFANCRPHQADFRNARFSGDARFDGTDFNERICFDQAEFGQDAWFTGVAFGRDAQFNQAVFHGVARFDGAAFGRDAQFHQAVFHGVARFDGAAFSREAQFKEALFHQDTWFDKTAFRGTALFDKTRFNTNVDFTNATAGYPNERHTWPARWEVRPPSSGAKTAQLVRMD